MVAEREYEPGGSEGIEYLPSLSLVVVRVMLVPALVTVTVAPTTAAPEASVTLPTMVAVVCCARPVQIAATISTAKTKNFVTATLPDEWKSLEKRVCTCSPSYLLAAV